MTSRNGYAGYHKEGDFSNARDDFLSVVPNAKMIYDARGKV